MNVIGISGGGRERKLVLEHIAGYEVFFDQDKSLWRFDVLTCAGTSSFFFKEEGEARALERRMDTLLGYAGTKL